MCLELQTSSWKRHILMSRWWRISHFWCRKCHILPLFFNSIHVQGISKFKVEKILKGSLDSIPSHSPSVKIQIMSGKVCLRCKFKTLLGIVSKLFVSKNLLTTPSNVLPFYISSQNSNVDNIMRDLDTNQTNSTIAY